MLYVYFGSIDLSTAPREYVAMIDGYFNHYYEKDWMRGGWAERVIREVDKSKLISEEAVSSPWLGVIPITSISGGAKQLIMAKAVKGVVYNGDNFGDNCFPLLLELSKDIDIQMSLYYYPDFEWVDGAQVTILNTGRVVDNDRDFAVYHMQDKAIGFTAFDEVMWPIEINKTAFELDPWLLERQKQWEEENSVE